ncbi:hypothetical protein [Bartonella gliris]|uniref:hypothetical protein n=1 Tax=Bartonella gliris TaxID=3004109 RepID=UPI003872F19C
MKEDGAYCVVSLAWKVEEIFHANLKNTIKTFCLQNITITFGDNGLRALRSTTLTIKIT